MQHLKPEAAVALPDGEAGARAGRFQRPAAGEWALITIIGLALVVVSPIILQRTIVAAMSDTQVFFRAGWAVWTGYPLYDVADVHGWHYHYPPLMALFMGPFADPLPGSVAWALPYPVAVTVWYILGVVAVFAAIHIWANILAPFATVPRGGDGGAVYWTLRLFPLIALMPSIGSGWARGQPTAILILLAVLFLGLYVGNRRGAAAIALSAAIAIKMFPAVLVVIPLLRRDFRSLAYIAAGCLFFLFVLPAILIGPAATIEIYRAFWTDRLSGLATGHMSETIKVELSLWPPGFVGLESILARLFSEPPPGPAPALPDWAFRVQEAFDVAVVALVAAAGHGRFWRLRGGQPIAGYAVLVAGAVLLAALPAMLPTAKGHYHAFALPMIAVATLEGLRRPKGSAAAWWLIAWAVAAWLAFMIVDSDLVPALRPYGLTTVTTTVLAAVGLVILARLRAMPSPAPA